MNKIVIYEGQENSVSILYPCECGLTIEQIAEKDVPKGSDYAIVDADSIPSDLTFFPVWKYNQGQVEIDLGGAKQIWKNKWREARKPKLEALDLAYMRATETQNTSEIARIVSEKQALRDVTNTPILGTTPEEIKAVWPEILN
jgi:hypothetical protein